MLSTLSNTWTEFKSLNASLTLKRFHWHRQIDHLVPDLNQSFSRLDIAIKPTAFSFSLQNQRQMPEKSLGVKPVIP